MIVNAQGRGIVDSLFPRSVIEWDSASTEGWPEGWFTFEINLIEATEAERTKLPLHFLEGEPISKATPNQLALLLAFGVAEAKDRSAFAESWPPSDEQPLRLFQPPTN
jgi:hypothetical protein